MANRWWQGVNAEEVTAYLLARQKPKGGFALTPGLPATIEDSYYAFRSLELLEVVTGQDALKRYLGAAAPSAANPAKVLSQYAYLCRRTGCSMGGIEQAITTRRRRQPTTAELYSALRASEQVRGKSGERLRAWVRVAAAPERLASWRTVTDLWHILVLREFSLLPLPQIAPEWLLACQNMDGGFGFLPGSTSFLENTFHGLRAARLLGVRLRWPEGCGRFVLRARSGGGFGRTSRAVPSPETTYMALASLRLLDGLEDEDVVNPVKLNARSGEEAWRPTAS
jgi:prenyltransferase beta subunit